MFIYVCHFSFKLSFARGFYCKQRKYLRKIQIQLIRIYTFFALILMLSSNNAMLDFQLLGGIRIFSSIDSCSVGLLYYFLFFRRQFSIEIIAWEKRPARVQKAHKQNTNERKNCYFAHNSKMPTNSIKISSNLYLAFGSMNDIRRLTAYDLYIFLPSIFLPDVKVV